MNSSLNLIAQMTRVVHFLGDEYDSPVTAYEVWRLASPPSRKIHQVLFSAGEILVVYTES
jgi:hypothetical protein